MESSLQTRRALLTGLAVALGSMLVLGLALIALFGGELPLEELETLAKNTRVSILALGLGVMTLGMVFVAIRWRTLIPGGDGIAIPGLTGIVCAGLLLNYALPGPVGEVGAAWMVKQKHGIPTTTALAASIHARLIGLALAGLLAGGALWLTDMPVPAEHEGAILVATICIVVGAVGLGLLSAFPRLLAGASRFTLGALGRLLPGTLGRTLQKGDDLTGQLATALGTVGRLGPGRYLRAAGWALAAHVAVTLGIWISCRAMGLDPHPAGILFTYCAATAAVVALIAFPGSQLGWDALFLTFLRATTRLSLVQGWAVVAIVRFQQAVLLVLGASALLTSRTPSPELLESELSTPSP